MSLEKYGYRYRLLPCNVITEVVQKYDHKAVDKLIFINEIKSQGRKVDTDTLQQAAVFNVSSITPRDIFYLCEYVPWNRNNDLCDARSVNFVLELKKGNLQAIDCAARHLAYALKGNCALVAIPSSDANKTDTSVHRLIRRVVELVGDEKHVIDASDCLVRKVSVNAAHNGGNRNWHQHAETMEVRNKDKIQGRNVVIVDDITTSGNSFLGALCVLHEIAAASYCFAVGKTVDTPDLDIGFIIDIDGTLFDTEHGAIKSCRDKRDWAGARRLAQDIQPAPGAVELMSKIREIGADYRLVTSAPRSYARVLAEKLGVDDEHLIAYHDTKNHKPDVEPYMKARQQMKLYDPMIVVIGDKENDMVPANSLDMRCVGINRDRIPLQQSDYSYSNLIDCVRDFYKITEYPYGIWRSFTTDWQKDHLSDVMKAYVNGIVATQTDSEEDIPF